MMRGAAWGLVVVAGLASGQLPASGTLSAEDQPLFNGEIVRVEQLLDTAPDKAAVTYQLARTWAFAQQWPEAMEWLRKVVALKAGVDPSRDAVFAALRGTREFGDVMVAVREATPAVSHSAVAFRMGEGDLVPESMAYDPRGKRFYFGSMKKGKVVRCSGAGECSDFATGLGVVLGLKVHGDGLWLVNNSAAESALMHYELASGRMVRAYRVAGAGHNFNDLTFSDRGDVYLTDTQAGAVWHLAAGAEQLEKLPGRFPFANGIALSADAALLYVSVYPDGLLVADLKSGDVRAMARPSELYLANIDGLYFYRGGLIAIQNGFISPRVVRLRLTPDRRGISGLEVRERRNPLFDGVTTGVIAGNAFFYMANIQDEKTSGFAPIAILKMGL